MEEGVARVFPDGRRELIAVTIAREGMAPDPALPIRNPLLDLTPEQKQLILSVQIQALDDRVLESMKGLDYSRVVISWLEDFWSGEGPALPRFPDETRHLVILLQYNLRYGWSSIDDFSALAGLTDLRTLFTQGPDSTFDLEWVRKNRHLTHLNLFGQRLRSPELLLRFPELERLNLGRTAVRDLSFLGKLTRLQLLDVRFSRVAKIPVTAMPTMRELCAAGAEVTRGDVSRFRRANPDCRVDHRWNGIFARQTGEVTGIRVSRDEKPVFEIDDVGEVRELLGLIGFHDSRCVDVDNYNRPFAVLLLLEGEQTVGELEVILGDSGYPPRPLSISWPGEFPGDGTLTAESATALARFLGERGLPELPRALATVRRDRAPELRRWRRYEKFLPEAFYRWLYCGISDDELGREFVHAFPDPRRRAMTFFLLLGAEESSWHLAIGLDRELVTLLLPTVKKHVLSRVAPELAKHPAGRNGLARWLFAEGGLDTLDPATRRKVLPVVARHALAHPRRINRQWTMQVLAKRGERDLLEEVVSGRIRVRPLPEADRVEDLDEVADWLENIPEEEDVADAEYARRLLEAMK